MIPDILPSEAIKLAIDSFADKQKTKHEFVEEFLAIVDKHPTRSEELFAIAQDEITKRSLPESVHTEIRELVEKTKVFHSKGSPTTKLSIQDSNSSSGSWKQYLQSDDNTKSAIVAGTIIRDTYRLEKLLGRGGMGEVWKAIHLMQDVAETSERDRYVAIKLLNADFKHHPDALKTLAREFARCRKLIHENIVQVYELNNSGDVLFIAMEYLDGVPLDRWIKEHPNGIPLNEATPIISGICNALQFAHEQEVIHLDIKPSNVFYDPNTERVKVIDFGIARHANPIDRDKTRFDVGSLKAVTEAYASLEMLRSVDPDPTDDIFGLACITFELLTGKHPYNRYPADVALSKRLVPSPVKELSSSKNKTLLTGLDLLRKERIQNAERFRAGLLSNGGKLSHLGVLARSGIIALVLLVLLWFTPKLFESFQDYGLDPIRDGILAKKKESAEALFRLPENDQYKVLTDEKVKSALVDIFTANIGDDPVNYLKDLPEPLQQSLFQNPNFKNRLIRHYEKSIDEFAKLDEYPKVEELFKSITQIYRDSNRLIEKKNSIRIGKNQRLKQLRNNLESCFNVVKASSIQRSDCLVSQWSNTLKVEPDNPIPVSKINTWFEKAVRTSLQQRQEKDAASLLANWVVIQNTDSPSRAVLRDVIGISKAHVSVLPELWAQFTKKDPDQRYQILEFSIAQQKLLSYVKNKALLSVDSRNYSVAFEILEDAATVVNKHVESVSILKQAINELKEVNQEKVAALNRIYQTKVANCDPAQNKIRVSIIEVGGNPLNEERIDASCIALVGAAINDGKRIETLNLFQNWQKIPSHSSSAYDALMVASKVRFHEGRLSPGLLTSMTSLEGEQQKLALEIDPVQERFIEYYRQTVAKRITASEFPPALRLVNSLLSKVSSHKPTVAKLKKIQAEISNKKKRKIAELLFEYQRHLPQCDKTIEQIRLRLEKVGAESPKIQDIDENCFRGMRNFLVEEDVIEAERILGQWRRLLPDNKTSYIEQRNSISELLAETKQQLKESYELSNSLEQFLANGSDDQIYRLISKDAKSLTEKGARRFWKVNQNKLAGYFTGKAKNSLAVEDYDTAQHYCRQGIEIYPQSAQLKSECLGNVSKARQNKISELTKIYNNYLDNGWLIAGIKYPNGILGILDELLKLDNKNHLLKHKKLHSAFKQALVEAVKRMQLEEARKLRMVWAQIFERGNASDDAVSIFKSANNLAASEALSIGRNLVQAKFYGKAKNFLQLGLDLKPDDTLKNQLEDIIVKID